MSYPNLLHYRDCDPFQLWHEDDLPVRLDWEEASQSVPEVALDDYEMNFGSAGTLRLKGEV
jgi:hypothetical protein